MKRSVYSLVLTDEVVDKIDEEAYSMGISRSALINRILAAHTSYITPQQRVRQIFGNIGERLEKPFIVLPQNSDMLFAARKALKYKYNPTIKYQVEITTDANGFCGYLKVMLRTQNERLIELLDYFFKFFCRIEEKYIGVKENDFYTIERSRFTRKLVPEKGSSEEEISDAIVGYINFLDRCIQYFFSNTEDENVFYNIDTAYRKYLSENKTI